MFRSTPEPLSENVIFVAGALLLLRFADIDCAGKPQF
jgi:hypothetical protein